MKIYSIEFKKVGYYGYNNYKFMVTAYDIFDVMNQADKLLRKKSIDVDTKKEVMVYKSTDEIQIKFIRELTIVE
jgi:hypothetical protein